MTGKNFPDVAPPQGGEIDPTAREVINKGDVAEARRYAAQCRAKAAAHRAFAPRARRPGEHISMAERLDSTADALYRFVARNGGPAT